MSTFLREEANGYWQRIRQFSPNAKKLILSNITRAFGWGITQTLLNLYWISLGYSKTFLGGLMSLNAFSMAIASLIMGAYVSRVGTKPALISAMIISVMVGFLQVGAPLPEVLLTLSVVSGLALALLNVSWGPFLARSSTAYERTHLFGTSQAIVILSSFISNTFAGYLPSIFAISLELPIDSPPTFQLALFIHVIPLALSIVPLLLISETDRFTTIELSDKTSTLRPVLQKEVKPLLLRFSIVNLLIGLGAGFVIPYLNIFFWEFYNLPTHLVGIIQGLGSLSVAVGVFLAPVLSTRIGKVKTVVVTQSFSLPFLLLIATIIDPYVAIASYIFRVVLMNASGPVDSALRMELVPERWRPTMSAVSSFSWNFPWAISTLITGPLFDLQLYLLPFWFTLTSYTASTLVYAVFFRNIETRQRIHNETKSMEKKIEVPNARAP
ncbi:MAG: MFS transporter [Candidatus Hodarchaeota archaeon]